MLTALVHRRAMPLLQSVYRPGSPLVARALYTIGLLNGYTGPEMSGWRAGSPGLRGARQPRPQRPRYVRAAGPDPGAHYAGH